MKRNPTLSQPFVALILLISLSLQSCDTLTNSPISIVEQTLIQQERLLRAEMKKQIHVANILLHRAVTEGDWGGVAQLLAAVNTTNSDGFTALHIAASQGHMDIVRLLIEKGADVNATIKYSFTPLHIAVASGHLEVVSHLLNQGADVNAKSKYSFTPLHMAVAGGHLEVVNYLLNQGAEVNAKIKNGKTPLYVALKQDNFHIIGKLLSQGANIND